jgi:hypothetical protein
MIFVEATRHMPFTDGFLYTNYRLTCLKPSLTYEAIARHLPNPEGEEALARSQRARWKHGLYSAEVRAKQELCGSYSSRVESC